MEAIVCTRNEPLKVLQLKEVAQPAPRNDKVVGISLSGYSLFKEYPLRAISKGGCP